MYTVLGTIYLSTEENLAELSWQILSTCANLPRFYPENKTKYFEFYLTASFKILLKFSLVGKRFVIYLGS